MGLSRRVSEEDGRRAAEAPGPRPYAALEGLDRAMLILEALADQPMRAKAVAERLGLSWTTAHRTLTYLRERGYIQRDPTGTYFVGSRLYYIGSAYVEHLPVLQAARAYLKPIADETGTTVQLVERNGYRSLNLMVFEPRSEYIPKTTIGHHFPLHCGAKGLVLLAYAEPEFIDDYLRQPLVALTPFTVTDPRALRQRLETIRRYGYAVTERDVQLSTAAVAAPVRDATGAVIASVTLIATHAQFAGVRDRLVDVVLLATRSISQLMGWHPATPVLETTPQGAMR
jgi:DNA-binding IclR family transcriptional regulator